MKLKKNYTFSNKRQIWRLLPTDTGKIIIEDRNPESREVFFNCLEINSGKKIFRNLQLDDKFWVGIEEIRNDIIFFHKFLKPDMPIHKGITAYDVNKKNILWQTDEYNFLFIKDDLVYVYKQKFEGKEYYTLNFQTGVIEESIGDDFSGINLLREEGLSNNKYEGYIFPENAASLTDESSEKIIDNLKYNKVVTGNINYILMNNLLFINFHEVLDDNSLNNIFMAFDINSEKVIIEETLDPGIKLLMPESFFIKDNLLFLIKEKVKLIVYSILKT